MQGKHDLRIKKTNYAIKQAFWKLIIDHGIKNVTTKQIIETAHINRTTFYNHYANKAALLSKVEDDLIDQINQEAKRIPLDATLTSSPWQEYHKRIIRVLYENGEYIKTLIDNDESQFLQKIIHQNRLSLREMKVLDHITIPENYVIEGLFGLASTIIYEWVKSGYRETPDEFFTIFQKMIQPVLISNGIIKK
ncbi:TetR/AcrR family transcriptional regulator [Lactobacillus sp. Sy-1]|uniref:TetR/AcrR family transcriptional regulator n=1 Tax=Lactobacillus sp. Sy-1 TaxID=2109645 RepID=UPI001C55B738|nr:TetR/AcrR family transcriptional regulator [Lactobacillus sp. Sy-1]MBW1604849.1 TetR/AcrR family transcriptional regulator [Lactobacillus sp. Sy-1]